jgi:membrane fusion protein (multidrug efflux system)
MAALALLLAGCSGTNASANKAASASKPVVATVAAAPASADDGVIASAPLIVENQVELEAQREGMMSRVVADTGTFVQKGQLLGELDDRQARAERDAAAARVRGLEFDVKGWEFELKAQQAELARTEKLSESGLVTAQELDKARYKTEGAKFEADRIRSNLESAREQLKAAEIELAKTRITAPFAGVIGRRYVRAGDKVTMGERLFYVTATAPLRVRFTLPERYVGKLQKGDMLALTVGDSPELKHAAKIVLVSPVVDPASGTIEIAAEVVAPGKELRPGMSANISLGPAK